MIPLNPPGVGGITVVANWALDLGTADADPGANKFRFNNADQTAATFIFINDNPKSGVDFGAVLAGLVNGDKLYIPQTDDTDRAQLYNITGATTDGTGYWKIPVTHNSAGTSPLVGAKDCAMEFYLFSGTGGLMAVVDDTSPQLGGFLDTNGFAINETRGANITAAATLPVTNIANWQQANGDTEITNLADIEIGAVRVIRFGGKPNLKNADSGAGLLLGGNDLLAAPGDWAVFRQINDSPVQWYMSDYQRASGAPLRDTQVKNLVLDNWLINTPQSVGDIRIATSDNNVYFECTVAGTTSGVGEPAWSTASSTLTVDGTVTWITRRFTWGQLYNVTLTDRNTTIEVEDLSGTLPPTPPPGTELFIQVTNASDKVLIAKGFSAQTIGTAVSYGMSKNHNVTLKINDTTTNSDIIGYEGLIFFHHTTVSGQVITANVTDITWDTEVSDDTDCFDGTTLTCRRKGKYIPSAAVSPTGGAIPAMYGLIGGTITRYGSIRHNTANTAVIYDDVLDLNVGDLVTFRLDATGTPVAAADRNEISMVWVGP